MQMKCTAPSTLNATRLRKASLRKAGEFGSIHLARGHREGPMVDRAETTRMTIDRHIVGRIGEHHRGAFVAQQRRESRGIERAAAEHAMSTEQPQIPDLANRRTRRRF